MNKPNVETEGDIVFSPTFDPSTFSPYDETQDLIFPSELEVGNVKEECITFN
jgi:hypothetical protein